MNLLYAGQVILDELTITTADGNNKISMDLMSVELDLFEDIYSPAMHGTMTVTENFNLILNLPIIGEETLTLRCHTPTSTTSIEKKFRVFKVSQREFENVKKHIYVLHFISIEAVKDLSSKVYSAYEGTPSDSATKIFKSYFPTGKLKSDSSANIVKYVAPTVSPFKAITVLANKAINQEGMPDYLFYEDNQGHNFVSLSTLFKVKPTYTFRYSASRMRAETNDGESVRDINAEYENVKLMDFNDVSDSVSRKMTASLGHKVWEVDMLRKSFKKHTYDASKDFGKYTHLNKAKPFSQYEKTNPEMVIEVETTYPYAHENVKIDRDAEILNKRPVVLSQTEWIKMDITVHGRTTMKVGDTINFEMPVGETGDSEDKYTKSNLDPYYSGKYLIAAIKHRFTVSKHEMILQVVKDSFVEDINFNRVAK